MTKIVVNSCHGGYGLSKEAYKYLAIPWDGCGYEYEGDRANPRLVECVEALGKLANGAFAELEVVVIPNDVEWQIEEYDGSEWVAEKHRKWPSYA
jgi:hypothetical protein